MNWYKFNVRDYLVATHHLADAEDLAYRRLLDLYYLSEKSLPGPVSVLAQRVNLDEDCVQPVLDEFFRVEDGRYIHDNAEEHIARRRRQWEVCSAAGKVGGKRPRPPKVVDLTTSVGKITVA